MFPKQLQSVAETGAGAAEMTFNTGPCSCAGSQTMAAVPGTGPGDLGSTSEDTNVCKLTLVNQAWIVDKLNQKMMRLTCDLIVDVTK